MNRIFISMLLVLVSTSMALASLEFEHLSVEGVVAAGEKKFPFAFPFVNTGPDSVQIKDIKSSCGCTVAKLDKMSYEPGETGVIKGEFSVGNRQGEHTNTIRIFTNSPEQQEVLLKVQVSIPQLVSLKPGLLLWRLNSEPIAKAVTVIPSKELGVTILDAEVESEDFAIELVESVDGDVSGYELVVAPLSTSRGQRALVKIKAKIPGEEEARAFFVHALIR